MPFAAIAADEHVIATPDTLKWGPAPPSYPKGAEFAIITGNPGQEGPFVLRIKAPAGYKVPPHVHPADENVTVISGTVNFEAWRTTPRSPSPPSSRCTVSGRPASTTSIPLTTRARATELVFQSLAYPLTCAD